MKNLSSLAVAVLILFAVNIYGCRSSIEAPTIADHPAALDGPLDVDFGSVSLGMTHDTTIIYFNSGTHPLHVDQRLTSDVFSVDSAQFDIPGRVTHAITFSFNASDTSTRSAYDTIVTNAGNYVVHLHGGIKGAASAYDYLFAVCDSGYASTIYRSTDVGLHWTPTAQLPGHPQIGQCFAFNRRLFATTSSTLYTSDDFGGSWNVQSGTGLGGVGQISGVGVFDSIVLVGERDYVYSSADGQYWNSTYLYSSFISSFAHLNAYNFGGSTSGLFYSYGTSGSYFYRSYSSLESVSIGALGARSPYLFAAVNGDNIYRSSDAGQTWSLPNSSNAATIYSGFADDGTWLYFATNTDLKRSRDNGVTWSGVPVPGNSVTGVWGFGRQILVASSTGIFRSHDGGDNWTPSSSGMSNPNARILSAMKAQ